MAASGPPSLSVVTFTNGPIPLIAASLRRVRDVADEILVAVDASVDPAELGPLRAVADRIIRAEFDPPLEANLAWLHDEATSEWVLRLDTDDVVSDALVRMLATPGWDDGITHAYLSYRWLWGGADRMLDQAPWWPDPVLRLVRRVPGAVRFPTTTHAVAEIAGASRLLDVDLYHLDLVLQDEAARAAKATGYERQAPGHRTDRGWSVSSTYYLPERQSALRTAPVPDVDRSAIEAVLAANERTARPAQGWPVPTDAEAEIVTVAERRAPHPAPGTARLRVLAHEPIALVPGRSTVVTVGITNRSTVTWTPDDVPANVLGGRVLDRDGGVVGGELRQPLPGPIGPGQEALVRLAVPADHLDQADRLEIGLLQEGVAWFDAKASARLERRRGRRVLVSAGVSVYPHLGDDLILRQVLAALARDLPDVIPVLLAHPTDTLAERFGCEVVPSPASLPPADTGRLAEPGRRSRDLVAQARRMAKGEAPTDPAVAAVLEPFAMADALIVSPGGGLANRYAEEALFPSAVEVLVARAFDLPIFVEGPSIGPLESRKDQAAVAQIVEGATRLTVRDPSSAEVARRIGKMAVPTVVADPATAALAPIGGSPTIARRWLHDHGVPEDRPYAVISLRHGTERPEHLEAVRAAVAALPDGAAAIYLPHCGGPEPDREIIDQDEWARTHLAVWDLDDDHAAVALVAGALVTVGTRFHLTVLAAAAGVPAVAMVHDEYDRRRLRGHRQLPGVRIVDRSAAGDVGAAVAALVAAPRPEPLPWWDPAPFTAALAAAIPAPDPAP